MDMTSILNALGPEVFLAGAGLAGVLLGAVLRERFAAFSYRLGAGVLFVAAGLAMVFYEGGTAFNGLIVTTAFASYGKVLCYGLSGAVLLMASGFMKRHQTQRFEFALLVIFAALGMGIVMSAANLMTLYMGIETLSLSSYVLAAFHRDSPRSAEAGLKYFVLGALASGLLLYGGSLVYGFSGSLDYVGIAEFASSQEISLGFTFGLVLMISALAFKVSAAPMHVWTPDVYEGAPTPVVALFASASKLAGMVMFAMVLFSAFGSAVDDWQPILTIIAAASMLIGAFGALAQNNFKRLLAYSSIANVGYGLVAITAGAAIGGSALLLFMTLYALTSIGLFAGVLAMRRDGGMVEDISELSGLIRTHPGLAIAITALLISIAGLPPLVGFLPKVGIIQAALESGHLWLAIVLVLSSVIAAGYYLRVVHIMWFREARRAFEPVDLSVRMVLFGSAFGTVVFMIFIGRVNTLADIAARSLLG